MLKKIVFFIRKIKKRKILECRKGGFFTSDSTFDGANLISYNSNVVSCHFGFASYIGENTNLKNVKIGKYTCIGPNVNNIIGQHPVDFVSIHPCFYSTKKQSGFTYVNEDKFIELKKVDSTNYSLFIGNDVWIGANVTILDGLKIGDGAIIAAGAVVTKDVEPYSIVGGVPAKLIKKRFNDSTIEELLSFSWWDKDELWIKEHSSFFDDVNTFLKLLKNEYK